MEDQWVDKFGWRWRVVYRLELTGKISLFGDGLAGANWALGIIWDRVRVKGLEIEFFLFIPGGAYGVYSIGSEGMEILLFELGAGLGMRFPKPTPKWLGEFCGSE